MWSTQTIAAVRDLGSMAIGSAGLLIQQVTGEVYMPLLVAFTAMVGSPGGATLLRLIIRAAALEQPSSPPPEPSQPGGSGP